MKMRNIFLLLSMLLLFIVATALTANALVLYPTNQKTLAWDEVTKLETAMGEVPLPVGNVVKYIIYYKSFEENSPPVEMGRTLETNYTFTFLDEGRYLLGVKAERYLSTNDLEPISESTISWSDIEYQTEAFGVAFYYPIKGPKSLR